MTALRGSARAGSADAGSAGWFRPGEAAPDAPLRLFLLHCAGAGAAMYHEWLTLLPGDVSAQCVQLPGRQDRWREPGRTELAGLLSELERHLTAELDDRPYALFGHSMGALLAYRLAVSLGRADRRPALLAVGGWAPRGFTGPTAGDLSLDDAALVARMRELGALPPAAGARPGTDPAVDDDLVRRFILPAMRADLAACGQYVDDGAVVGCPIVAYAGAADPLMAPGAMASWRSRTAEYLGARILPGGHFFLDAAVLDVVTDLTTVLRRCAL